MSHRTPCNPLTRVIGAIALAILAAGPVRAQVINEPPLDPIGIVAFPSRDFVSTSGWLSTDLVTIEVIRNGIVVSASPAILTLDGLADVNHPGNVCWGAVTPDLRVNDIVRCTARDAAGAVRAIHQTHVSGVTNERAVLVQPDDPNTILGEGIIQVRGTAYGANGQPLPIEQLESRIIANSPSKWRFQINGGRRTIRASLSHPDLEGVISYDTVNNPLGGNWTATYSGLGSEDVTIVMGGLSALSGLVYEPATACCLWLGVNPLTVAESTIYENDDVNIPGPAAGACFNPLEALDVTPPSKAFQFNMAPSATGAVTLSWGAATDDWAVAYYQITRNGEPIANVPATVFSYVDATPPAGVNTYGMRVYDHATPLGAGVDPVQRIIAGFGRVYGNVSALDTLSAARDFAPPTVPTNLVVVSKPGQAQLSWAASTDNVGVASYRVYRSGVAVGDVAAPATSFVDAITASGTFTYTVDAADAAGNRSAASAGVTSLVRIPADIIPPGAPTLAAAIVTSTSANGTVTLDWTPAVDNVAETGYAIYRDGALVDSVLVPTTTWTQAGVAFGTYSYQVDAYDAPFNHGAKSAAVSAVVAPPVPGAPTALLHTTATTATGANVTLSWTPAVDLVNETGYGIYRDGVLVDSVLAPATSWSQAVGFGTFLYQVDAYVAGVNRSALSGVDSVIVIAPPPPVPGAPTALLHTTATTATGANVTLNWTPAVDLVNETGYGIYRDGVLVDSVLAPATSWSQAVVFGRYGYQVDAYVAGVNRSALSGVDSVIVIAPPPPPPPPAVPGAPTALLHTTATTATGANVTLSWTPAVDLVNETGYGIYRNGVLVDSVLAPATSWSQAVVFGRYGYQVDAYVAGVNRSVRSAVDSVIVIAPPPPPPPVVVIGAPGVPASGTALGNMTVSTGANIGNSTLPFATNWTASASATVTRYQLQVSVNSAAWTNVTTASPLAISHAQSLAIGTTTNAGRRNYQYRVRAFAGTDSSAWAIGQRFGVTAVDNGSASITYTGAWTTNNGTTGAYGGSTRSATAATASATYRTAVLTAPGSISWVTSRGPGRGRVLVSVDGAPAVTVDLYATTTRQAVVAFVAPLSAGVAHTIRIAPAGARNAASTSNRIDVDAFMLVTAQAGITPAALTPAALETETEVQPSVGRLSFAPISPNPSRGVATLSFGLPREGDVEIGIVDVQGRQVRSLHRGSLASGPHTLTWDGRSSSGQSSAPGIYFAVLRFSNETRTQRIVRVP